MFDFAAYMFNNTCMSSEMICAADREMRHENSDEYDSICHVWLIYYVKNIGGRA